jgi:hypothetical protein
MIEMQGESVPYFRRLIAGFILARPGLGYVGFVLDEVAQEQVFSEYFACPS